LTIYSGTTRQQVRAMLRAGKKRKGYSKDAQTAQRRADTHELGRSLRAALRSKTYR